MVGQNITAFYLGISPDPRIAATRSYTNWSSFPRGLIVCSLPRTIYSNEHIFWSCKFLSSLHLTWLRRTGESQYTPPFLRRTCPASALVGLEVPLLLVVIPGGERHERTTFHSGCSCWSGKGCHHGFHPRLFHRNRSRARTIFNVNVVLNCKAERDNTNANKHDRCNRSCIYILNRELSNKFRCNSHLQILASLLVVFISFTSSQALVSIDGSPVTNLF